MPRVIRSGDQALNHLKYDTTEETFLELRDMDHIDPLAKNRGIPNKNMRGVRRASLPAFEFKNVDCDSRPTSSAGRIRD